MPKPTERNEDQPDKEFVFFSNRAARLFAAALAPLGGRAHRPGENPLQIDLLYFDSFTPATVLQQVAEPTDTESIESLISERCLTLIPRSRTRALDDKAELARALLAEGVEDVRVYFAAADVPNEPDSLWYVKEPFRSGGEGIAVVTWSELQTRNCRGSIIQEAIQDLTLVNGRKFTLRLYVLVHAGRAYLYEDGFAVVHAVPYQVGSTDPRVQFVHAGYLDPASGIELIELKEIANASTILANAARMLSKILPVFRDRFRFEPDTQYCLFGVDVLVRDNLECVLVEVNDRPNLVHSQEINERVNVPMLQALVETLKPEWSLPKTSCAGEAASGEDNGRPGFTLLTRF